MSARTVSEARDPAAPLRPMLGAVRLWLACVALLIAAMVVVGGATRLTDSGLSITEWQLVEGMLPPLSDEAWREAFALYRQIPEYHEINPGMSLEEFKIIYWWEWAHRFLGRFVGFAFLVPLIFFWWCGALADLKWKLLAAFALGGAQGALGWYMVQSGLVDRVDVSQYRLAAHLGLALALFGWVLWLLLDVSRERANGKAKGGGGPLGWAAAVALLVFAQCLIGAFVAGLHAGLGYNTWPLMDERWIPQGLLEMSPPWINLFENPIAVQFAHRTLAYVIVLAAGARAMLLWRMPHGAPLRRTSAFLFTAIVVQAVLGIATLLAQVPLSLGLAHQFTALVVWAASVWHLHASARPV